MLIRQDHSPLKVYPIPPIPFLLNMWSWIFESRPLKYAHSPTTWGSFKWHLKRNIGNYKL